jgi:hypothetical protein
MTLLVKRRSIIGLTVAFLAIIVWLVLIRAMDTEAIDSFNRCVEAGNPVSGSNPPTCTEGNHYFMGPLATPEPVGETMVSQPFQVMVDGDSGGIFPRSSQVINDPDTWQDYWRWIHDSEGQLPPILPVDFSKNSVIVISEGQQQTSGYVYKVTGIMVGDSRTTVEIRESIPTITCKVKNTKTNRYHIVKTEKLKDPVVFRESVEHRKCQ